MPSQGRASIEFKGNINRFLVFVGQWAKPIEAELSQMIEKEFVYDEHWDLGYGWSGDM